jgi:hypothetical protein
MRATRPKILRQLLVFILFITSYGRPACIREEPEKVPKYNPFRPNGMVTAGMFCGRSEELRAVEECLYQTKHGNPKHFLLSAERGVGKSSLLLYIDYVAKGDIQALDRSYFNFIVISIELVSSSTNENIVSRLAIEFKAEVARRHRIKQFSDEAWDFVRKLNVTGVEYKNEDEIDDISLVESLSDGISGFFTEAGDQLDGILILIDEADRPSESANLGEFCKLLTERLTKSRCDHVCVGLAGLPSLAVKLRASHESSPRIFENLSLNPLGSIECEEIIRRGLREAEKRNGFGSKVNIDDRALAAIVRLSEGYPHFIQQFSYSAFAEDRDDIITIEDVETGAFKENGALDQLGKRYFSELYFEKITEDCRGVLNAMADKFDSWMTRKEIMTASGLNNTHITNAMKALKDRGIILGDEHRQGQYRLPSKSFAIWIKALNAKGQNGTQQKDA